MIDATKLTDDELTSRIKTTIRRWKKSRNQLKLKPMTDTEERELLSRAKSRITYQALYPRLFISLLMPHSDPFPLPPSTSAHSTASSSSSSSLVATAEAPLVSEFCGALTETEREEVLEFTGVARFLRQFESSLTAQAFDCLQRFVAATPPEPELHLSAEEKHEDGEMEDEEVDVDADMMKDATRLNHLTLGSKVVDHLLAEIVQRMDIISATDAAMEEEREVFFAQMEKRARQVLDRRRMTSDQRARQDERKAREDQLQTEWRKATTKTMEIAFDELIAPLFIDSQAPSTLKSTLVPALTAPPYKSHGRKAAYPSLFDNNKYHRAKLQAIVGSYLNQNPPQFDDLQEVVRIHMNGTVRSGIVATFESAAAEILLPRGAPQKPHLLQLYANLLQTAVKGELERGIQATIDKFFRPIKRKRKQIRSLTREQFDRAVSRCMESAVATSAVLHDIESPSHIRMDHSLLLLYSLASRPLFSAQCAGRSGHSSPSQCVGGSEVGSAFRGDLLHP